jgi:hypothetical protein
VTIQSIAHANISRIIAIVSIRRACIFTAVKNVFEIFSQMYIFLGCWIQNWAQFFFNTYHFSKICIVNNFRYVYTGLMNLIRKSVQIKDELGQLCICLLKTIRLPYLQVKFYSVALYCLFSCGRSCVCCSSSYVRSPEFRDVASSSIHPTC